MARSSFTAAVLVSALLCLLACKHDLDALRAGGAGGSPGAGGGAGGRSGSGGGGSGGMPAGIGGNGEDAGPLPAACQCPPLPSMADAFGITHCCRGAGGAECGVSFEDGGACVAPAVLGHEDANCPDVSGPMSTTLAGCCRTDGYCGFSAMAVDLGCIRREDIPERFGGPGESIPCRYPCAADVECRVSPMTAYICVESEKDQDPAPRFCAKKCDHDGDCEGDTVCAITNNDAEDRVDAYCQASIGSLGPGATCDLAEDCVHGLCARIGMQDAATCAELCRVPGDCPPSRSSCINGSIPIPSKRNEPPDQLSADDFQKFGICAP